MKVSKLVIIVFYLITCCEVLLFAGEQKMVVCIPVADLRKQPITTHPETYAPALSTDVGGLETQLRFGEFVIVDEEQEAPGWLKVRAVEQEKFLNNEWVGYPGYIQASQAIAVQQWPERNLVVTSLWATIYSENNDHQLNVTLGTCLSGEKNGDSTWSVMLPTGWTGLINASDVCEILQNCEQAKVFRLWSKLKAKDCLESPYVWGGCSAHHSAYKTNVTGFDCSGLVWLIMKACGLAVPRDAHDQYLKSTKIENGADLRFGDLAFFVSPQSRSGRMSHVMFYIGNNQFIEATGLNYSSVTEDNSDKITTRILEAAQFLKKPLKEYKSGDLVNPTPDNAEQDECCIYFGTFFGTEAQIQQLRDAFLTPQ